MSARLEFLRRTTPVILGTCLALASGAALANLIDTISGLKPGDLISCKYTFKNGDPAIPCASDIVGADGKVSFIKPNAPFDGIEYKNETTGGKITAFSNPIGVPIETVLLAGMELPHFTMQTNSFFDVFVELDLPTFTIGGLSTPGTFTLGQELRFINGVNQNGYGSISADAYTGSAFVSGYDRVTLPEPSALALAALALLIGAAARPTRA